MIGNGGARPARARMGQAYQSLPTQVTIPNRPSDYAGEARNPLPILTISDRGPTPPRAGLYQHLPPRRTKPNRPSIQCVTFHMVSVRCEPRLRPTRYNVPDHHALLPTPWWRTVQTTPNSLAIVTFGKEKS